MCELTALRAAQVLILGGGPNRIGQGIEFDYCCCHASFALRCAAGSCLHLHAWSLLPIALGKVAGLALIG